MSGELIDRARLRRSLDEIVAQTERDGDAGRMRPWVHARLEQDVIAVAEFEQFGSTFEFRADESVDRGGHGSAPSPMRYLLSSLAFCVLGWAAKTWASRDIPIRTLEADVRTFLDVRGEHLVAGAAPNPQWFVIEVHIDDDASPDESVALLREAVRRCPTTALVSKAVPVHLMLVQRGWTVLDTRPEGLRNENREELTR